VTRQALSQTSSQAYLAVAPQGILKEECEFAISVGNVSLVFAAQRVDDVSKGRQGFVDVLSLLKAIACGIGL